MRIITGTLKGRKLSVPRNVRMRPTSDRTKESIFAIIDVRKHISDSRVLDLFAGSGSLGFEALSRGASGVTFIESSRNAVDHIRKTAETFGVDDKTQAVCTSVEHFLNGPSQPFDLVFADPPYEFETLPGLPDIILDGGWLTHDGWFILEHDKRHSFADHPNCAFSKPYGRTIVTIFTQQIPEDET
ncbi:16S rRNA (guanine(966)-N(2))-methyltransferase RsmD [Natronogracilivirga saccharolytica]|uniref:16S rRNA (Guanine(966)-N(2))-methyltransferase RsmD n=1 Tax=Natronogracilivirga saccharolytica TaxID=2812953 RepID=A0A8J7RS74_9BACT|nr:16S rRNA (guanine(966)-N(2))-methyltransferase RsmD [Natronogracilivirga saccharolytica]MBP3192809.1 16S rRNA (guanine(966)-N(2))-methyltransferase RsmD [Natronogracilivirga saccharolytica]